MLHFDNLNSLINRNEILRYAGCMGSEEFLPLADSSAEELSAVIRPRAVYRELSEAGGLALLSGSDVRERLEGSTGYIVFAATLGAEADSIIQRAQVLDMEKALFLNAAATAAIEAVCDDLQKSLREEHAEHNRFLTKRFSPGYGDYPLSMQYPLLKTLDAERRLGLSITSDGLLVPKKSVTAIIGIGQRTCPPPSGCGDCRLAGICNFYKPDGK